MDNFSKKKPKTEVVPEPTSDEAPKDEGAPAKGVVLKIVFLQIFIGAVFLSVGLVQPSFTESLTNLKLRPELLLQVNECFARQAIYTVANTFFCALAMCNWLVRRPANLKSGSDFWICAGVSFIAQFTLSFCCLQFPYGWDDTFIDYRYVKHWSSFTSFDYNPGEHIMGFTSHTHVLLLTLLKILLPSCSIPVLSSMLNAGLVTATCWAVFYLLCGLVKRPAVALLGVLLFALGTDTVYQSFVGKEGAMIGLFMTVGLWAWLTQRRNLFIWTSVLIFLTRPEGVFWLAAIALCQVMPAFSGFTNQSLKAIALKIRDTAFGALPLLWHPAVLMVFAWYAFLFAYFGTIIPHGAVGKSITAHADRPLTVLGILQHLGYKIDGICPGSLPAIALGLGIVSIVMMSWLLKGRLRLYYYVVVLTTLFFSITNCPLFPWYLSWYMLMAPLLVPLSVDKLLELKRVGLRKTLVIATVVYSFFIVASEKTSSIMVSGLPPKALFTWNDVLDRMFAYQAEADFLNKNAEKRLVASPEIGMLGYLYDGPVMDVTGLISDGVFKYYPVPQSEKSRQHYYSVPVDCITGLKPPMFTSLNGFLGPRFETDEKFLSEYEVWQRFPCDLAWWKTDNLVLYVRKDLAVKNGP